MRWLLFAFASACSFSTHPAQLTSGDGGTDAAIDAPPDGLPATCAPNDTACDGRVQKVCGSDGHWDATLDTTCDFTCSAGACVVASNVAIDDVADCGSGAPALAPPAGAMVTLSASGGDHIECTPDCGNGVTRIDRVAAGGGTSSGEKPLSTRRSMGVNTGGPEASGPASSAAESTKTASRRPENT